MQQIRRVPLECHNRTHKKEFQESDFAKLAQYQVFGGGWFWQGPTESFLGSMALAFVYMSFPSLSSGRNCVSEKTEGKLNFRQDRGCLGLGPHDLCCIEHKMSGSEQALKGGFVFSFMGFLFVCNICVLVSITVCCCSRHQLFPFYRWQQLDICFWKWQHITCTHCIKLWTFHFYKTGYIM